MHGVVLSSSIDVYAIFLRVLGKLQYVIIMKLKGTMYIDQADEESRTESQQSSSELSSARFESCEEE